MHKVIDNIHPQKGVSSGCLGTHLVFNNGSYHNSGWQQSLLQATFQTCAEAARAGIHPLYSPDFIIYYNRLSHETHDLNFFLFSEMKPLYIVQTISTDGINK